MADHHPQHLPERLLLAAIEKSVSEKLGGLFRDFSEFTKNMTEADAKTAKLMILEMMRDGGAEFYFKMKVRIESKKV